MTFLLPLLPLLLVNNMGHVPTSSMLPPATTASINRDKIQPHLIPRTELSKTLPGPELNKRMYPFNSSLHILLPNHQHSDSSFEKCVTGFYTILLKILYLLGFPQLAIECSSHVSLDLLWAKGHYWFWGYSKRPAWRSNSKGDTEGNFPEVYGVSSHQAGAGSENWPRKAFLPFHTFPSQSPTLVDSQTRAAKSQ